jgi:hypothetical protein
LKIGMIHGSCLLLVEHALCPRSLIHSQ